MLLSPPPPGFKPTDVLTFGFAFDSPVPLIKLGARFHLTLSIDGIPGHIRVTQVSLVDKHGDDVFQVVAEAPGLIQKDYDRFGTVSRTSVLVQLRTSLHYLVNDGLVSPIMIGSTGLGMSVVSTEGVELCAALFNQVVDFYTVAYDQYWVPRVTAADLMNVKLLAWFDPHEPCVLAGQVGSQRGHMRLGVPSDYPTEDPHLLKPVVDAGSLPTWRTLEVNALRALETEDHVVALMNACLAFESFLTQAFTLNQSRLHGGIFRGGTLKSMCAKNRCPFSALFTTPLNSPSRGEAAELFSRFAAMRDNLMHAGSLRYSVDLPGGGHDDVEVHGHHAVLRHLEIGRQLRSYVSHLLREEGLEHP